MIHPEVNINISNNPSNSCGDISLKTTNISKIHVLCHRSQPNLFLNILFWTKVVN